MINNVEIKDIKDKVVEIKEIKEKKITKKKLIRKSKKEIVFKVEEKKIYVDFD